MGGSEMSESEKTEEKAPETKGKIQRSVKSMIKQMKLSDDEMKYRMDNFDNVDVVKEYLKYLKCTKCNMNFQQVIKKGESVGIHPLLGVLMCDSCCEYYGDGNFSLDSEGEDKYCRWCGEGGTIFACSKCICGFCDMCIKKHFGEKGLEAVEKDDDWICYFCNPQPLWHLRSICSLAKEAAKNKKENMRKGKEGASVRKKRRKMENLENDIIMTSSESSGISNNSNNERSYRTRQKRKRHKRLSERVQKDESSSSEDEKENCVGSKKKTARSKKQASDRDEDEDSSVTDTKKKSKVTGEDNDFQNKRKVILEKFKSIWKLTQTITEVGLSSSRDKLKNLAKSRCSTLDHLRKEHEDLKSCIAVLVSSLNTASNSVDSIKEDLTFDTTKDDTESFRSQEIKLKRFAEKFHEELDDHTSVDSEGDSFRKERGKREGRKKDKGRRKSENVKNRNRESGKNSEEEQKSGGENKSKSLFSDSCSDEKETKQGSVERKEKNQNGEQRSEDSEKNSAEVKPLLKVKSFARMLHENVYDKNKARLEEIPIVIDLDSDENDSKKKESSKKDKDTTNSVSNGTKKKSRGKKAGNQTDCVNEGEDKGTPTKENELEKSTNDSKTSKESSGESEAETKKRGRKNRKEKNESEDSESEGKKKRRRSKRNRKKDASEKSSDSGNESFAIGNGKSTSKKKETAVGKKKEKSTTVHEDKRDSSGGERSKFSDGEKEEEKEETSTTVHEDKRDSSGGETSKFSDGEKEEKKEESPADKEDNAKNQSVESKNQSKETSEDENEKHNKSGKKHSGDEKSDKDLSETEREGNKEFNATTDGDDDDDDSEKTKNNTNEDGNEKSGEESKDSSKDNAGKMETSKTSDSEKNGKRDSSSIGEEEREKSPSKDEKSDSSDSSSSPVTKFNKEKNTRVSKRDSSSIGEEEREKSPTKDEKSDSSDSSNSPVTKFNKEKNIRVRRGQNKFTVSFEKFKRKREQFLKSSKESSNSEREKSKVTRELDSSESENENKTEKKSGRPKRKRLLESSDEEDGTAGEKTKGATSSEESEKENQKSEGSEEVKLSAGSESSSEAERQTKKRKRVRNRKKGSSDSSEEEKKKKKKRQDSSDSSEDEGADKKKKGRRNIKKILKKDSLEVETKEALKNEDERKKRLKERQKLFEELFPQEEGEPKKLILDFDPETKEPLVTVHKKLLKHLKPHQMKGVKFMWDSCFETVEKLEEESGSGCILAHCMGLGKTLQVITLVHTVMNHDLGVNTVLIICPLSTVSNWIREFESWLANVKTDPITLYDLVKYRRPEERLFHIEDWHENGGVLVLSYDLFRTLVKVAPKSGKVERRKRKNQPRFEKALIDPGPDLVICDEGHLLKNEDTALSKCVSRIKTSRRIVLTGTPLQNNLIEYHCMVQFVKPNILGTKKEFCNRFVNPINNGQFEDSTELDVKIMKRRSHVLHSMLDGCIQRFDYSVLTPFLPEKHEYVLSIALTDTQMKVYSHFLQNFSARVGGGSRSAGLFNDYHHLQRIWTHPRTMLMQSDKDEAQKELASDSEGSLKDFVVSESEESETPESSDEEINEVAPRKRLLRSNANDPEVQKALAEEEKEAKAMNKHWWDEFYDEKAYDDLRESNKLVILFSLLKHCARKKDKLLIFSQSLYSLDLIEYFLAKIDENSKKNDESLCGHRDDWILGTDYFRLDGSTTSEMRDRWCKVFNKESNSRARLFLISTRAGGLGINLYAANRVVIFDASWNPSHDLQSIFRVYRFGQKKPCFVYRFLSEGTMEEKIYERQVTKLSLAHRVVDEHQIGRHYTMGNLQELYAFQPTPKEQRKVPNLPKDEVLADILSEHKDIIVGYHEHDSLLENKQEEELTEEERRAAWKEYEEEKVQKTFSSTGTGTDQFMFLPQGQQFSQEGPVVQQFINPAALNQINMGVGGLNLMHSNIPLEFLERGVRLGVIPLPNETVDSYVVRILNKESWMKANVPQGQ